MLRFIDSKKWGVPPTSSFLKWPGRERENFIKLAAAAFHRPSAANLARDIFGVKEYKASKYCAPRRDLGRDIPNFVISKRRRAV